MPRSIGTSTKSKAAKVYMGLAVAAFIACQNAIAIAIVDRDAGEAFIDAYARMKPFLKYLVPAIPAALFAGLAARAHQRHSKQSQHVRDDTAESVMRSLQRGESPPFSLYLRSFEITNKTPISYDQYGSAAQVFGGPPDIQDFERLLADTVGTQAPLIGLGQPGEAIGAGRLSSDDADWQETVKLLAVNADTIFLIPLPTEGTTWEVELLCEAGMLGKTIFIMPPDDVPLFGSSQFHDRWKSAIDHYAQHGRHLQLPDYHPWGMLFRLGDDGQMLANSVLPTTLKPAVLNQSLVDIKSSHHVQIDAAVETHRCCPKCGETRSDPVQRDKADPPTRDRICKNCSTRYARPMTLAEGLGMLVGALICGFILFMMVSYTEKVSVVIVLAAALFFCMSVGFLVAGIVVISSSTKYWLTHRHGGRDSSA